MQWHQVLGFVATVIPLTLIPGTSLTLVTQQVIAGSRADGALVTLGPAGGFLVHAACAAVGLSALVMSSAQALTVVKLLGGGYLVWLGVTMWRAAGREAETGIRRRTRWCLPWARLGGFAQGLWSNVLNPKAASVYLTLVPQFLTPGRPIAPQVAALALAHIAVVLVWLLFWTTVVAAARTAIDTPRFRRRMSRLAGAVLVAWGVRTAAVG
ncbi:MULTISPECIES: LysE family translocator [Streptomyces]|uniref:LysE family translocator n=2 Tax=Streptomyces rimosus subsp. rimosus TaxID=132474 RepID=L8EIT3_STRR1|nr:MULTISPECIES: LysE family translocator [Streptomyces]KOG69624.1 serine/threonine protein kinase [Kitasatospora aureofaciens]MYT44990.1 LysE family transporter [Streptomyces sp. SID5471]KEF08605.1 serine/threonine protein kinase [Streptomyces rimosus]KEF20845.1 serine/threonine protein kinase [Streptomyces rimosus]KUJ40097.1 serine/threonine protein kinase [Streptomyces rimosus subsp. rimosus]